MEGMKLQIAKLRKKKGITQAQLADALGVVYQTVSKWENGASLPDISLLPKISRFFEVTVDEILGLRPLPDTAYLPHHADRSGYWDAKLDYLKNTRSLFWNDDYLEFLVRHVWKIDKPVDVVDFGCGYGFLGLKLLPLLPPGSTYTGLDINEGMIEEGRRIFANSGYRTSFRNEDVNKFQEIGQYDVALCQAFLRHIPNPREILGKMVDAVRKDGLVVCIEVSRNLENSGMCIQGLDFPEFGRTSALQKFWKAEFESEGRDYALGMKVPFYLHELGLKNIDVRLNDRVNFLLPGNEHDQQILAGLDALHGWDLGSADEKGKKGESGGMALFMNRGLSRAEVEGYEAANEAIRHFVREKGNQAEIIHTLCLIVSFGWKR